MCECMRVNLSVMRVVSECVLCVYKYDYMYVHVDVVVSVTVCEGVVSVNMRGVHRHMSVNVNMSV